MDLLSWCEWRVAIIIFIYSIIVPNTVRSCHEIHDYVISIATDREVIQTAMRCNSSLQAYVHLRRRHWRFQRVGTSTTKMRAFSGRITNVTRRRFSLCAADRWSSATAAAVVRRPADIPTGVGPRVTDAVASWLGSVVLQARHGSQTHPAG